MKKTALIFGAIAVIALLGLSTLGALSLRNFQRETNTNPQTKVGYQNCETAYRKAAPVIAAVDMFRNWKGRYPVDESELGFRHPIHPISYSSYLGGFVLDMKMGWDASLRFLRDENGKESLHYDPGDGRDAVDVVSILGKNEN